MREMQTAKNETFEGHEATKALVLAVAGLMAITLISNLLGLCFGLLSE
jgi:hypothetical protein